MSLLFLKEAIWVLLYLWINISSGIKVSDILNAEYLPSTLFLEEAAVDAAIDDAINSSPDLSQNLVEGDIRGAFATMQFHRSKMNEFLCRNYLADEILAEIGPDEINRRGLPAQHKNHRPKDSLLKDQGSSTYKDWLSRATLLDDVYRHYDQMGNADSTGEDEIESGEVTGYAVQGKPTPSYGNVFGPVPNFGTTGKPASIGGQDHFPIDYGHQNDHSEQHHTAPVQHDFAQHGGERADDYYYHHDHHDHHEEHSSGKGLALKDLFDLALTALAFLAFGMFVMNLIMNCMITNQGTTIVMNSTTASTGPAAATGRTRLKRMSYLPEDTLNEMAYRVLSSVDKFMELNSARSSDRRVCLHHVMCENNKYSRRLNGKDRIWLPVWSFGLSWILGKIKEDRLGTIQASVLGLGDADCNKAYPGCARKPAR